MNATEYQLVMERYHAMSYDQLANAVIKLQKVIDHDTEIGAVGCVAHNTIYLQMMDVVLRIKEGKK